MCYFTFRFMIPYYEVMTGKVRRRSKYVLEGVPGDIPGEAFGLTAALPRMAGPDDGDGNDSGDNDGDGTNTGVVVRTKPKTKKPSMYKVIMLNDDYTPMEFVILVLERYFQKTHEDATRIMLHVHQKGVGVCGVYTYEVAETKVQQVMDLARQHQHPLQCTLEKA